MRVFDVSTWIAWIGATVAAALSMAGFAYNTFSTKEEIRTSVEKRLDRIENKVDRLIERGK